MTERMVNRVCLLSDGDNQRRGGALSGAPLPSHTLTTGAVGAQSKGGGHARTQRKRAAAASLAVAAPLLLLAALLAGGRAAAAGDLEGRALRLHSPPFPRACPERSSGNTLFAGDEIGRSAVEGGDKGRAGPSRLLAASAAMTGTPLIEGGLRPFGLPQELVADLDPAAPLTNSFLIDLEMEGGTIEWLGEMVSHRGWFNYAFTWNPAEDPAFPRAVDEGTGAAELVEWMEDGWDGSLWAGDYVHAKPGINASAVCQAPLGVPFYVPVYDSIPVCDPDIPAPKPACPVAGGGYAYHVAGVAAVEVTACSQGASEITGKLVNRVDVHKDVTPTIAFPGQAVTYTITFSNATVPLATGVVLTDLLPAEIVVNSVISTGALITDTGLRPGYAWQVADLPLGTGGAITITGVVSPGLVTDTLLVNTAEVLAATDGTGVPNTSEAELNVLLPRLSFSSATYAAGETTCAAVPVTVTLFPAWSVTVTVRYTATDGTAAAGDDYVAVSGTLEFPPGATSRAFGVDLLTDLEREPDETVLLELGDPVEALLGTPVTAVLTLLEASPGLVTGAPIPVSGPRPFGVPAQLVAEVDAGGAFTVGFDANGGAVGWTDRCGGPSIVEHRGWFNYDYTWNPAEDPVFPRAVAPSIGTAELKEWMEDGWEFALWEGDYVHAVPGINAAAVCQAPLGAPFYVPVYDAIPVCSMEVPDPKPACPSMGGGYVYHVVGVVPIEITACNQGLHEITARLVNRIDVHKGVTPTTAAPGQAVSYTITFSNGTAPLAAGVVLTDLLPAEIVVSTVVSAGALITDTGLRPGYAWRVADLPLGTGGAITITGVVSSGLVTDTVLVNTAQILAASDGTDVPNTSQEAALTVVVTRHVAFAAAVYTATETAGAAAVAVELDSTALTTVTVHYTATDGTAAAGEDYVTAGGVLTFPVGVTWQVFSVGVLTDTAREPDETVLLALSDPSGAALGTPGAAVLTIVEGPWHDVTLPLVLR